MAELRTNLTDFLRNSLSGAQENSSIASNALVVPIGKRTNLSAARIQINKSFDAVEKALRTFMEANSRNEVIVQKRAEQKIKTAKSKGKGGGHNNLAVFAGLGLGFAFDAAKYAYDNYEQVVAATKAFSSKASEWIKEQYDAAVKYAEDTANGIIEAAKEKAKELYNDAFKYVSDTAKGVIEYAKAKAKSIYDATIETAKALAHKTSEWIKEKLDAAREGIKGAYNSLVSSTKGMFTYARDAAVSGLETVGNSISNAIGASVDKVREWDKDVTDRVDRAFDVSSGKVPPPSSELPAGAKATTAEAVAGFWAGMTKMLRNWLWSLFSTNASVDDAEASTGGGSDGFASFLNQGSVQDASPLVQSYNNPAGGNDNFVGTQARPPEAEGKYRPVYKLTDADLSDAVINHIAGEARTKDPRSVDAVINNFMNRVGTKAYGPSGNLREVATAPSQYIGNRKASPKEAEFIRERIKAIASGGVPDETKGANEFRTSSYTGRWMQNHPNAKSIGGNSFAYNPRTKPGPYAPYSDAEVDKRAAILQQTQGPKATIGSTPEGKSSIPKVDISTPSVSSPTAPSITPKPVSLNTPTTYSKPPVATTLASNQSTQIPFNSPEVSTPSKPTSTQVASNTTEYPEFNSPHGSNSTNSPQFTTPNTSVASISQVPESSVLPAPTKRPPVQEEAVASASEQPSSPSFSQYSNLGSTQISPHFRRIQNNMGMLFFGTEGIG